MLDELEQRHLGGRPIAGVGGDHRHVLGDRERLTHVLERVLLLAVEEDVRR